MRNSRPNVVVIVAGLPRNFESYRALVSMYRQAGVDEVYAYFWDYRQAHEDDRQSMSYPLPRSEEDWNKIKSYGFTHIELGNPVDDDSLSFDLDNHPLVPTLKLSPKYLPTKSWLTAISQGVALLDRSESSKSRDLWVVTRPDVRFHPRTFRRVTRYLDSRLERGDSRIATPARQRAHRVLDVTGEKRNLPVDHFFIGRPETISHLARLSDWFKHVRDGSDQRQPVVNEFLIGQYLADNRIDELPVRLPYIVWRGSLYASLIGFGRGKLGSAVSAIQSLAWLMYSTLFPGAHKSGL